MSVLLQQELRTHDPKIITTKGGLTVEVTEDVWQLLPTPAQGWKVDMSWVWATAIPDKDRNHILIVLSHYATTKAASTTMVVALAGKRHLSSGIPSLVALKSQWSGFASHEKKRLNQFFGTLRELGHKQYTDYHNFTRANQDKGKKQVFDPEKGALNQQEFDSFCANLNLRIQSIDWSAVRTPEFFRSNSFGHISRAVSNKLLTLSIRRPYQLSMLKWIDVIPAGSEFSDPHIDPSDEVGNLGINQLQIRFFYAKGEGRSWRTAPETYPIALNAQGSEMIARYKRLYIQGIQLWLDENGCKASYEETVGLVSNMPVFLASRFFKETVTSIEQLRSLFTPKSRGFHADQRAITKGLNFVATESSRVTDCRVSSNRIRHTVLTRGAQSGYTAATLAKITGVTVPAARHYIDLDYESRLMIDELYMGSEFLASLFSDPLESVSENDAEVLDHEFNSIGGLKDKNGCSSCLAVTGRPIGCYGCNNFRPILEANHAGVLELAELKLEANSKRLLSPEEKFSVEKLTKQIGWIKRTIDVCNQVKEVRRGVE